MGIKGSCASDFRFLKGVFMIYDELYAVGSLHSRHTIWVFSDLQQAHFEDAKRCLDICMNDYVRMGCPAGMIWYLGDSTEGADLSALEKMTELQENAFGSLNIPLCYATGNHDYDYQEYCYRHQIPNPRMPFWEMVRNHEGWMTTKDCEETWFSTEVGNYTVYFFCDHVAGDNSWCSTHNRIRYGAECYPYGDEHFAGIRRHMEACPSPYLITAAHCAFPGGNRETELLGKIQPLPLKTRLHLYGHSHIGEYTCPKNRIFSQIQWVDWQDIPQVDVASFENIRGAYCHSVFLQIYEDDSLGLFFRNHDEGRFVSAFFPAMHSCEREGCYEQRRKLSWTPWDGTPRPE